MCLSFFHPQPDPLMTMKTMLSRSLGITSALAALGFAAIATSASAQIVPDTELLRETFEYANGSSPDNFLTRVGGTNTAVTQDNRFRFRRVDSGQATFSRYVGDFTPEVGDPINASSWSNYIIESQFRSTNLTSSGTIMGQVGRWQEDSGAANDIQGYLATLRRGSANNEIVLSIIRDFNNVTNANSANAGSGTVLVSETFTLAFNLANNTNYRMSFELAGSTLTFSFMDNDRVNVYSVTATDSTYQAGNPGLRGISPANGNDNFFNSMIVTSVIPEPAAAGMLLGLMGLGFAVCRRRRLRHPV